ncbi:MAG: TIR domain-containing protein [Butyrivibrio sp.]|nr:TIR domain-containing protein [Butyrivibrio sp.]
MDIFFSYRRDGGLELTRSLKMALNKKGYTTFFDNDSIGSGEFPTQILNNIERSDNFVLILSSGALDRCRNEGDWVRREIEHAVKFGKNIIPVFSPEYESPADLPVNVKKALDYQGVYYNPMQFNAAINDIVKLLRDENGKALRVRKKRNVSNFFYAEGMSPEERKRISHDYESVKKTEKEIWDKLLEGKENLTLFAPAVYDADTYMKKYNRPEFAHVFSLVNTEKECEEANEKYGNDGANRFYVGNMEHSNFEDEMDQIMSDNEIRGFDFVDLTLILRDSSDPSRKLRQVVDRMNPGGIVYIREFDHDCALAYPDEDGRFEHILELINYDKYSGDFYAGRKVYAQMLDAYLEDIVLVDSSISTVGLTRKERGTLFEALFSYVPREYTALVKEDPDNKAYKDAQDWLTENYDSMKREFMGDNFFYRAGYMFFYGYVPE